MLTLKFDDTHNMVAFLSKPTEGEEGIDCLLNSTIIEQLALIDEEGIDCLLNSTIIEQLALIGSTNNVVDEAVYKELGDSLARVVTPASSLEAEQDSGNINKTQSKATPDELSSHRTDSSGGPIGNTLQSDEDRLKLNKLMALCTNLQTRVLDLEKTKTTQSNKIASLKRRVKKLTKKNRSTNHKLKRLYKVCLTHRVEPLNKESLGDDASKQGRRIDAIDQDEDITPVNVQDDVEMFDVDDLGEDGDKGKWIIIKEPVKPKKKDQVRLDKEAVKRLQAEFDEEERLAKKRAQKEQEANIYLIETWDDIHVKINVDHQLAKRLQSQEQEELSDAKKTTSFVQCLEKRRKHFAAKRAEEKRNKPPIQAQKKKIMCNYLKNMEGYALKQLKLKEFDEIQEMFDKALRRVNTFEDFISELV
nr:hypothetical protein [Tanacetum cinerariifolium]